MDKEKNSEKPEKHILMYILLFFGIVLILAGIMILVSALNTSVPALGEDGWFEASSQKGENEFWGATLVMVGIFVTGSSFATKGVNSFQRKVIDESFDSNTVEDLSNTIKKVVGEQLSSALSKKDKTEELTECKYCGAMNKKDSTECKKCGAPLNTKRK